MPGNAWDRMAAWRDERSGETGDLWHRAIIDPTLLEVIGTVRGLRVLEIACGNGYLARRFAADGAREVVAIDSAPKTLARARARERRDPRGVRFQVADAARLGHLADGSFDLVVANMALMDIEDGAGTVGEVARLLDPHGRFVFSICHPCFDTDADSAWILERSLGKDGRSTETVWRKVSRYRAEGRRSIPWDVPGRGTVATDSFHRTLTTYSRLLRRAGLVIARLEEPTPLPEALAQSPQAPFMQQIPLHLIVEAIPASPRVRPGSGTPERSPSAGSRRSGSARRRRGTGSRRRDSTAGS